MVPVDAAESGRFTLCRRSVQADSLLTLPRPDGDGRGSPGLTEHLGAERNILYRSHPYGAEAVHLGISSMPTAVHSTLVGVISNCQWTI